MMQLFIAAIAFYLASKNRGNEAVQFYWTIVTAYWIVNYVNGRRKT